MIADLCLAEGADIAVLGYQVDSLNRAFDARSVLRLGKEVKADLIVSLT
jgi:hypothetical protein